MKSARRTRVITLALAACAIALIAVSYFVPWWHFWLFAPQYPKGLEVLISLTGFSGDVRETDILNHYVGMRHLEDAAHLELRLAAPGIAAICVLVAVLSLVRGRVAAWIAAAVGVLFPLVFIGDSYYWLHRYGHELNPRAPLRMAPFTPTFLGTGTIGQFSTFARPEPGFWLAVIAAALLVTAAILKTRARRAETRAVVEPTPFAARPSQG